MSNLNNGNLERKVKGEFRARSQTANAPCAYCHQPINYHAPRNHPDSFEACHRYPVNTHPHLAYDITNYIPGHSKCNRSNQDKAPEQDPWVEANW